MRKNIFLALDFNSLNKALEITEKTQDHLAGIKIGLELYSSIGLAGIKHFEKFIDRGRKLLGQPLIHI